MHIKLEFAACTSY